MSRDAAPDEHAVAVALVDEATRLKLAHAGLRMALTMLNDVRVELVPALLALHQAVTRESAAETAGFLGADLGPPSSEEPPFDATVSLAAVEQAFRSLVDHAARVDRLIGILDMTSDLAVAMSEQQARGNAPLH